jgi:hypothetical protein
MNLTSKIGAFFLIVGGLALVIFFASTASEAPSFDFLLVGLGSTLLGGYLIFQGREPPAPSGRFRILNRKRKKEEKEEQE